MSYSDYTILFIFFAILTLISIPLGRYMAAVFAGEKNFLTPVMLPAERFIYSICGIKKDEEMTWKKYAAAFIIFNTAGILLLFLIQLIQGVLPLNPQKLPGVRWDTALNTAVSFVTNTNWQSYTPETTMSYFTQMTGLTVQNFISAAAGMAAGLAMIRGFIRRELDALGNMWVDITRALLYILLPLSVIISLILISRGVIQNLGHYINASTLEGGKQLIPMGPVASQEAIKMLGTNGGGFFNANSAHPFENPTFLANLIENFSMLLIPFGFVFMFGYMIKNSKQARAIFITMAVMFIIGLAGILYFEFKPAGTLINTGLSSPVNMEGKEVRHGILWSALWGHSTTVTSCGAVNSMHDSFMPVSGLIEMFNIGIGEVIFGGVGVGFIGMMFYVILSMFLAGLMIGRTPEFMGKKFGPHEMVMSVISLMTPMVTAVILGAIAVVTQAGLAGLNNPSSHGLSEIIYAYKSGIGNNGSAFAGLNANTVFYNITIAIAMLVGRFATIIPALAVAGSLAVKKIVPDSDATFPTTGILFVVIVVCVILIMGGLTYFPIYSLGPVLEHLFMSRNLIF